MGSTLLSYEVLRAAYGEGVARNAHGEGAARAANGEVVARAAQGKRFVSQKLMGYPLSTRWRVCTVNGDAFFTSKSCFQSATHY
jgi:hypothetical protein